MRLFLGTTLAAVALLSVPLSASAAWVEIGASDETTLEIDDRIQSQGQYRWYWIRLRHTNPIDGRRTRIDAYQSADCFTRQIRVRETKMFDGRGRLLDREALGNNAPVQFVSPGTLDDAALAIACQQ